MKHLAVAFFSYFNLRPEAIQKDLSELLFVLFEFAL